MAKYSLTPELKAAIRVLPWKQRISTRWKLALRLRQLTKIDNAIEAIEDSYDCGSTLINYITGNRHYKLTEARDRQTELVAEITGPLLRPTETEERRYG